jgi:hypothetical protein
VQHKHSSRPPGAGGAPASERARPCRSAGRVQQQLKAKASSRQARRRLPWPSAPTARPSSASPPPRRSPSGRGRPPQLVPREQAPRAPGWHPGRRLRLRPPGPGADATAGGRTLPRPLEAAPLLHVPLGSSTSRLAGPAARPAPLSRAGVVHCAAGCRAFAVAPAHARLPLTETTPLHPAAAGRGQGQAPVVPAG